jgi:shikimate dehydrogenase
MKSINKDTKIYGSFSSNPGNNGCIYFNNLFEINNINAIYKSFYSSNIKDSVHAVKTLNISGFAVSMPFKIEILKYVDKIDTPAEEIGAANTIINDNGYLTAYNTDWMGIHEYFLDPPPFLTILGNGGFSKAIQYACKKLNINFSVITRKNWDLVPSLDGVVINATPVDVKIRGKLIDGRPFTEQGKQIAQYQAFEQYKLYINE